MRDKELLLWVSESCRSIRSKQGANLQGAFLQVLLVGAHGKFWKSDELVACVLDRSISGRQTPKKGETPKKPGSGETGISLNFGERMSCSTSSSSSYVDDDLG